MNPKKPKDFIKPTAEVLQHPESLVDDIVSFYWSTVRKALTEFKGPSITVPNLGTFKARYSKLDKIEHKYQTYLEGLVPEKMTFNKHTMQNTALQKLEGLRRMREEMQEEYNRKLEVKRKRKEYEARNQNTN